MTKISTTTENTKIGRNNHGEWQAVTTTATTGKGWYISTSKRYSGKLVTTAQMVNFSDGAFQYSSSDKVITLISQSVRVTEKAVREQHTKALLLFDENEEIKSLQNVQVYEIKIGQRVFLEGYGKGKRDGNAIIYNIQPSNFGVNYLTVDTNTLKLSSVSNLRDYDELHGIGTYYEKGDVFKGSFDELDNIVIEAKKLEAQEAERRESAKLLSEQIEKGKIEEGKKNISIPEWAKTVIVADLYQNDSDIMSDYFATSVIKTVVLAFSDNTRNNMQELKKASLNFEETKNFIHEEETEHTRGNSYLPDYFLGSSSWFGWKVNKSKFHFDLTTEEGKNKVYKAFAEGRYFVSEQDNKKDLKTEPLTVEKGEIQIIDYSEKSIAVIGDTKPIKDKLKELGGKFNFRLSCGAGWIFPKTKMSEIENIFN